MNRRRAIVGVLAALAGGCQDAALEWRFAVDGVTGVETIGGFVRDGACGSAGDPAAFFFPRAGASPILPAPLEAGSYCLEVVAYDDACVAVGRGEQTLVVPSDEGFVLVTVTPDPGDATDALCAAYRATSDGGL